MIGERVGPYVVLERLGSGGMGEVYLAEDTRLGRRVALKRPGESWLELPEARERLRREASAAGRLSHPNIAAVYDVLDAGRDAYIVMEYVEGPSLAGVVRRGPVPVDLALELGIQIADALAAAHAEGIVHRDLKPANIMLTPDGRAKVLDFGIAKGPKTLAPTGRATLTLPGQVMGTPGYSSPEQLAGAAPDPRDDIYSLGIVLFELMTGQRPFKGEGAVELMLEAISGNAQSVHEVNRAVPLSVAAIVSRAMAREREDRFQSAEELRAELRHAGSALANQATGTSAAAPRVAPWRRPLHLTVVAVITLAVTVVLAFMWWRQSQPPSTPEIPVVAVLPFANHSQQPHDAPIAAAMRDVLIANLGGQAGVNVLSKGALGEAPLDRGDLTRLSRVVGATYVVDGSLQRSGNDLRVTVSLVRGDSGYIVWSNSYSAPERDVFSLQERVAAGIGSAPPLGTSPAVTTREAPAGSRDIEAITHYGQAVGFLERPDIAGNLERATQLLRAALARDPAFALAWARLGEAYWATYQKTLEPKWASEAAAATHEARRLDSSQPGVWISLATINHGTGRHEQAIGELHQALALQPNSDDAHRILGQVYRDTGRPEEAVQHYRKAIELRPNYWRTYNMLGALYYATGRTNEAIEAFTRVTELQPDNARGFHNLGTVYYGMGDHANALKHYKEAIALGPMADTYSNIGTIHYDEGRFGEAVEAFKHAVALAPNDGMLHGNLGDAYARLKDTHAARRAYEEAVRLDRRALTVNSNDAMTRARLAQREAKLGRRRDAERNVARALTLNPHNAEVLYHCAVVRALNGNADAALDLLAQAVAKGYSAALASRDHDLASIRELPRFREIVSRR